ncbi:hypothetical protein TNCV_4175561 [Trichonephila clavipes]|nr:hypothetical protein TNCV_4175561 [Trichonephila clavipes]
MQVSSGTKNNSFLNKPSCTTVTVLFNGVLLMVTVVTATHTNTGHHSALQFGATCAVTSTHVTIILESLEKPGDDTLDDSKFLGYFHLVLYYGRPALSSKVTGTPKIRFQILVPNPKRHPGKTCGAAACAGSAARENEDPGIGLEREAIPHYSCDVA